MQGMIDMRDEICMAAQKDLGKDPFVTELTDLNPCIWDTRYHIKHLDSVNIFIVIFGIVR